MLQKKVCMLGASAVGKTSLFRRFVTRRYDSDIYKTTLGVTVDKKPIQVNGQEMTLVLWDIHGDDAFEKIRTSTLRGMSGYLLVADGTRRHTLEEALALNTRVTETMAKVPAVLVLNKCDLADQWEIEPEREAALAKSGWTVLRTSAKTGESVEEAFLKLAQAMLTT
jgi:small GTP-binding protein